jgi:hypothetical protein
MTDKVRKIKEWISKTQDGLMDANGNFEYPEHEGAYHILCNLDAYIDSLQEEPVSKFLNTESMIELYKQRLISQANGVKNSPLIDMCLASYKHGINETLNTLKLPNIERTIKNRREEPISEDLEEAADNALNNVLNTHEIVNVRSCLEMFRFGAEWQLNKIRKNELNYGR